MKRRIASTLVLVFSALPISIHAKAADCHEMTEAEKPATDEIPELHTVRIATGLDFSPLFVTAPQGDFDRIFVVEQRKTTGGGDTTTGRVRIVDLTTQPATLLSTPFLTVTVADGNNEQGLLGLAFDPDYVNNGVFYLSYNNPVGDSIVARYVDTDPSDNVHTGTSTIVLLIEQPFGNHNGGWIDIGPDGYLYVAIGDGGSGCDPNQNAQDITGNLLGKILRVDPLVAGSYTIPPDNPFVGVAGDDEIWAYGLRNPWRPSFDRETGDFYIADVGQLQWEEINFQFANVGGPGDTGYQGGINYGWDCAEGRHNSEDPFKKGGSNCSESGCVFGDASLVDPIHEYAHSVSGQPFRCSITGGYVYRGSAIPALRGTYFYADYCSDEIWTFESTGLPDPPCTERTQELAPGGGLVINDITSFGEDAAGELYICDRGGDIYKIVREFDCPEDIDPVGGDDAVSINDLRLVLLNWKSTNSQADVDGNGTVDINDLRAVILAWGNCP